MNKTNVRQLIDHLRALPKSEEFNMSEWKTCVVGHAATIFPNLIVSEPGEDGRCFVSHKKSGYNGGCALAQELGLSNSETEKIVWGDFDTPEEAAEYLEDMLENSD